MGMLPTVVIRAALLIGGLNPAPAVSPDEFRDWFESAHRGRLEVAEGVAERARGYRYVFVLGLMNERMPGYFNHSVKELRSLGVPAEAIHRIAPSSNATFVENLGPIRSAFLEIAARGPEPLVIVGHSRGACDALAFALHEPAFVSERVAALFLIQGPFGGSGAADYLLGEGIPIDDRMPTPARLAAKLLREVEQWQLERGRHAGIADLTSEAASRFWKAMLENHKAALPIVGPRTFYIESTVSPTRHPLLRRPVARYLETYYGPNDGLVAAGDQSLPGLGTRLGMFDVGHSDLTLRFPAARPDRRLRDAMTRAIVLAVAGRSPQDGAVTEVHLNPPDPDESGSDRQALR